jgi:hypothetical protein
MKVYEDVLNSFDEWQVTSTVTLQDDGRFDYEEYWTSYGGTVSGWVQGVWRGNTDGTIFLRAEHVEGAMYLHWTVGQERQAIERDDSIEIQGWSKLPLLQQPEPVQITLQTKAEETVKPNAEEEEKKKSIPTVANLHFKDGSIQQRQLPNNPLFGLFDEMLYRLVDNEGNVTNVFKARQNSENDDSSVVEYDEIDFTPTVESDDF